MNETIQMILLVLSAVLFGAAFWAALGHMRRAGQTEGGPTLNTQALGPTAWLFTIAGLVLTVANLIWRTAQFGHLVVLKSHLDAFLLLGTMLGLLLLYFHWSKHLRSLAFFFLPMIATVLLVGGLLQGMSPSGHEYDYHSVWTKIHVISVMLGALCLAVGCIGAGAYLIAARQLKNRGNLNPSARPRFLLLPPLATIERFNQTLVYLGFPLLTLSMIAGFVRTLQDTKFTQAGFNLGPKVVIAIVAWIIYAVLMHVPLAPAIRGRRAAWLNVIGFVLLMLVYVAMIWMK